MDTTTIKGLGAPFDGTHEMGARERPLTTLEWRWIKKISGYLPETFEDGFHGRDPDLFVALAVIALVRNGKVQRDQALTAAGLFDDAPAGADSVIYAGGDADDPPAASQSPTEPVESVNGSTGSSGSVSEPATESQDNTPSATGGPSSAITSISARETSLS
jgi:hypothetical protein